ncbi:hypothetical protein ACLKA7_001824 [Drosophila subpalustris]
MICSPKTGRNRNHTTQSLIVLRATFLQLITQHFPRRTATETWTTGPLCSLKSLAHATIALTYSAPQHIILWILYPLDLIWIRLYANPECLLSLEFVPPCWQQRSSIGWHELITN